MDCLLMEERKVNLKRRGKYHSYHFDMDQEDPLLSVGTALLFRSAFGRSHPRLHRDTENKENTDYGALRSKKHLKCSRKLISVQ